MLLGFQGIFFLNERARGKLSIKVRRYTIHTWK